jgi:hypothetical protein
VHQELDGRYTEIGIVSFGRMYGCEFGYPAAFTRVTSYLGWIEQITGIMIASLISIQTGIIFFHSVFTVHFYVSPVKPPTKCSVCDKITFIHLFDLTPTCFGAS